ncbi:MAG: SAM-dependent methyltransferase [Myxococcales bacterium]|nr:SAM-dependent methyltransferase [Myxococcales bacterium]
MRRKVPAERVRRELLPEQSPELLRELHLLTRGGQLNADALRKLKQVNHLVELLRPALEDAWARHGSPVVVDAASGNAYLGFILYELWLKPTGKGELWSVEARPELSERAKERAARLGYERMRFVTGRLEEAQLPPRIHLLTALHACDTATDDALSVGVRREADHLAVVPCCQAELARQLQEGRESLPEWLRLLSRHPLHRREVGSQLTNAIRALWLESHGYQVTVTELTGWEHSLKNELILGRRVHRESREAQQKLHRLLLEVRLRPRLVAPPALGPG